MKKKLIVVFLGLIGLSILFGCDKMANVENLSTAVWEEISVEEISDEVIMKGSMADFDLKKKISENDYVFSGTIVSIKEFENSWTGDNGELWGPFSRTIIEVKLNKEYYGKILIKDNVIKVCYPHSLLLDFGYSVPLKKGGEYIFLSKMFSKDYIEERRNNIPESKSEIEKHADVIIGGIWNSLFPVQDEKVTVYHEYFYYDNDIMKRVLPYEPFETNKKTVSGTFENSNFIVFSKDDFEKAFLGLFEKPEKLPDADALKKIREEKYPQDFKEDSLSEEVLSRPLPPPAIDDFSYEGGEKNE